MDETRPHHPSQDGGLRFAETATHWVDVMPMAYGNWRIVTTEKPDALGYSRGWCYQSKLAAVAAAEIWDGSDDTRPVGWIKEVHTGERPDGQFY